MDISDHQPKQKSCPKHNQPILLYNFDPKIGACCLSCLQNWPGITLAEQLNNQQKETYNKVKQQIDTNHQQLQSLLDALLNYKEMLIQSLDKIIQVILDQLKFVQESKIKLFNLVSLESNESRLVDELKLILDNQYQLNKEGKNQVEKQLNSFFSQYQKNDKLLAILNNNSAGEKEISIGIKNRQLKIQEGNKESQMNSKKFQYVLMKESTLKQVKGCYAFAFNKDNSILIVACDQEIIVYPFLKGKISTEIQRLQNHTSKVCCLYFMRNSNSFVSGSFDNSIIIWILDQYNKYIAQQFLKEHQASVYCIVMNKIEDLIISGSADSTLKVWRKVSRIWICSQSIYTIYEVRSMSLNEQEDKLIIVQANDQVQILVLQNDQNWIILSSFIFPSCISRICFTIRDQFVLQNIEHNYLSFYDYDANIKEFKEFSSFEQLSYQKKLQFMLYRDLFFPCQLVKSLNILILKHDELVNILKLNENQDYELIQEIQYGSYFVYGRITDDAQYLVTWDDQSKEIQIRQMKYME